MTARLCAVLLLVGFAPVFGEAAWRSTVMAQSAADRELIVLAAPITGDPYYADSADAILTFHVAFARAIDGRDDVVILVDDGAYDRYVDALGPERVVLAPVDDIWMRDFGTANPEAPVLFRYTAAGQGGGWQGQIDADAVQEGLAAIAAEAGLRFRATDLLNDGGNFVDDGAGRAVVSRKFLRDNGLTEEEGRRRLRAIAGLDHVAFIEADEQGGLEHADGVVAFVDVNTLIVNSYADDPAYAAQLRSDLERGLPGVVIHEVVTPFDDSGVYDPRFGSACGLYTNALVTPHRVYLPQFAIPEDAVALTQVRAATAREVVPVPAQHVCFMGGGVRCMAWQLRGPDAAALAAFF